MRVMSAGSSYLSESAPKEVTRHMRNPCPDQILIRIQHYALRAAATHAVDHQGDVMRAGRLARAGSDVPMTGRNMHLLQSCLYRREV